MGTVVQVTLRKKWPIGPFSIADSASMFPVSRRGSDGVARFRGRHSGVVSEERPATAQSPGSPGPRCSSGIPIGSDLAIGRLLYGRNGWLKSGRTERARSHRAGRGLLGYRVASENGLTGRYGALTFRFERLGGRFCAWGQLRGADQVRARRSAMQARDARLGRLRVERGVEVDSGCSPTGL